MESATRARLSGTVQTLQGALQVTGAPALPGRFGGTPMQPARTDACTIEKPLVRSPAGLRTWEWLSNQRCNFLITSRTDWFMRPAVEFCSGPGPASSPCFGDSGGPLVIRTANGTPKLAGLVSWGAGPGCSGPAVYTEMPSFRNWVSRQVGGQLR